MADISKSENRLDNQSKSCDGHFNVEFVTEPDSKNFIKSLEELIKELLDE